MIDVLRKEPYLIINNTLKYSNYEELQSNVQEGHNTNKEYNRPLIHFHGERSFGILPEAKQGVVCAFSIEYKPKTDYDIEVEHPTNCSPDSISSCCVNSINNNGKHKLNNSDGSCERKDFNEIETKTECAPIVEGLSYIELFLCHSGTSGSKSNYFREPISDVNEDKSFKWEQITENAHKFGDVFCHILQNDTETPNDEHTSVLTERTMELISIIILYLEAI